MKVKKICCLDLGRSGVVVAALIAANCPEIKVTVVQSSLEKTFLWTAKSIPPHLCGTRWYECFRKCHNKNLFFTPNGDASIKDADMILIVSDSKLKVFGEGKGKVIDLTQVQVAAHLIAAASDSSKIVVEMSGIPANATKCIRSILKSNGRPGVEFRVLSSPTSCTEDRSMADSFSPQSVLIGGEMTAAKHLATVYERWMDARTVVATTDEAVDAARLCTQALVAQRVTSLLALAPVCEKIGADVEGVARNLGTPNGFGHYPNRVPCHFEDCSCIVYALIHSDCFESSKPSFPFEYWSQVPRIFSYHSVRLAERLRSALNRNLEWRKIAIFGFPVCQESNLTRRSVAVDLCGLLLRQGARVRVCDPSARVNSAQAIPEMIPANGLKSATDESAPVAVTFVDPVEATSGCEALVICSNLSEVDFRLVYSAMTKPPWLLDCGNFLAPGNLAQIGFQVMSVGKTV